MCIASPKLYIRLLLEAVLRVAWRRQDQVTRLTEDRLRVRTSFPSVVILFNGGYAISRAFGV
jgi:hypothetical protein